MQINDAIGPAPRESEVRAALDLIRPGLLADGGNVEFHSVAEDGTVCVTLQGACAECPAREMTRRKVIEVHLKHKLRGVSSVLLA